MKKAGLTMLCVFSVQGVLACGATESDPIFPASRAGTKGMAGSSGANGGNAGSDGMVGTGGSSANAGKGGKGGSSGSSTTSGGTGSGATGGDQSSGGTADSGAGGDGTSGEAGAATGGSSSGTGGNGGSSGAGESGSAGQPGIECSSVHPNVNGTERTCNADRCYCSGNDGCFEIAVASSCCEEPVVCDPGAMNPIVTINHPGTGETRLVADGEFPFVGVATDPQDGSLSGAALVWTSSELGSPFGTGEMFDAVLPTGVHVITLTATDSDSNTGTDTITVTME